MQTKFGHKQKRMDGFILGVEGWKSGEWHHNEHVLKDCFKELNMERRFVVEKVKIKH